MKKKMLAMAMVAIMAVGVLSGCSSKVDETTGDTAASDTAVTEASAEVSADVKIAYMAKNVVDAFAVKMNNYVSDQLDKMKDEGLITDWQLFDATSDPSIQVSELEDAINNGFNFFLLQPCEAAGSDPVVTRCKEKGFPCVVINSTTESTMQEASGYAGSDDVQAGEMMGKYILEKIPEGGTYVHMMGVVGNSAQVQRPEGINNTLTAEAGWTNGGDYAAEWLAEKAVGFATDAITQYGDELKAIVCDNDDMSSAVQAYCNSVNRSDIICIGVDGNQGPLSMIKEGTLDATIYQDGEGQCDYAINTIARALITGETDGVEMFKTDVPFILITKDNVDQYLK